MDKKSAVITGSTRGIGLAIAEKMAAEGYSVVISGRNAEKVKSTVAGLKEKGYEALGVSGDVSVFADAENLIKTAVETFGKVDVLVNNAGITRDNLLMRMSEEEWDDVIRINLKGTYNCAKVVARPMMKKRNGVIINITSVVGEIGNAGQANYAASKAGIIGFTKSLAKELASRNIRANAVAPGFIKTDMTDQLTETQVNALKEQIPLQRLGEGEDVANLVAFLASDKADYITGQVFNVDGGMVI
jgi:3-oxoacyl-[acyl-carrier protein] reductase